jgi:AcrR family transcriptional regulator
MPRGRPSDTEQKKQHIMNTALTLFSQKGVHATSTRELAVSCGIAEGLIFYYFGGKRELLRTIVHSFSFVETLRANLERLKTESISEAFVSLGLAYLSFLETHKEYLFLLWSPELMQDEEMSKEVGGLIQAMSEASVQLIAHTDLGKKLAPQRVNTVVAMLLSPLLTYFMIGERNGERTPAQDEAYVRGIAYVLLNGIGEERDSHVEPIE